MDKQAIVATLKALRPDLNTYKVQEISLFGSFAQSQQTEASDIDVLVKFAPDASFFDLVRLALFLEDKFQRKVDVVPQDSLRLELREKILRERIVV